ncbi:membrane protein [Megasphaera cerevisiae DSM 20462]|uniref:Membrane protein n=1 Tax=Megasphaera cerevisiae DSM 20462 TaxID=1122219 RepID=A0A0J6WTC4_9FIRM|nr:DUF5693 family protein [Megasphaera cerevisiae]KMO86785.1 membrane protein [Megasphaera cerevisiae DSM 20462]SJZ35347.1 hypothetical protein SAMN05660900_00023 [Megasphaera cerevisiae DSM 20462]
MAKKNSRSKVVMILAVLVGLVCSIYLCVQRYYIEENSMAIEQAMDYDAVVNMARNDGYDLDTALEKCRDAGITSFTIYDTTLNKLTQRGELSVITKLGFQLYYPQFHITNLSYDYYLIGKPKGQKDAYFDEVAQDLKNRLGSDKVGRIENDQYRILGLRGVMPELGDLNLGIMTADANTIASHGFHVILRPTNYSNPTPEQVAGFFKRADTIQNVSGIMFVGKEVLGYTAAADSRKDMLTFTADHMKQRNMPFYMIESVDQLQYNTQDGMYDLAGLLHYRTARVYAMAKEELEKITPEEAAMRYYISDLERNVRVNLFPLYKKPLHGMNLTETNLSYIKIVSQKLQERGYSFGNASIMPVYYPNKILLAVAAAAAACGFLFTLNLLIPLSDKINYILMAAAVVFGAGGAFIAQGALFLQLMAVGCATTAPVAAILILVDKWRKMKLNETVGYGRVIRDGSIGLSYAVAIAMVGGLFIAALLGNIRFFMEFDFYRGVKITFILPLILITIGYLYRFPFFGQTVDSTPNFIFFVKNFLDIPIKMGSLVLVAVLGLAAFIFVGRSGHTAGVPVPGVEVEMRRFLENVMYARPREKEFLVGHPAFFLMVASVYRKWPQIIHYFMVIAATIGVGSMVETFAHIRTPFIMSFIRGINGWITGMIIGILLICGLAILQYMTAWFGKRVKPRD